MLFAGDLVFANGSFGRTDLAEGDRETLIESIEYVREVVDEERIPLGARIRDVEQGPDGLVYVLTDQKDGNVWRISPLK